MGRKSRTRDTIKGKGNRKRNQREKNNVIKG